MLDGMSRPHVHGRTSVHLLNYHIVWCPKRRRRILVGAVRERLISHVRMICQEAGLELIALEVMPDHVHCFVGAPPSIGPSMVVQRLKGVTSRRLRAEFPALRRRAALWSPSFFIGSTGNVSSATVVRYIAHQRSR